MCNICNGGVDAVRRSLSVMIAKRRDKWNGRRCVASVKLSREMFIRDILDSKHMFWRSPTGMRIDEMTA